MLPECREGNLLSSLTIGVTRYPLPSNVASAGGNHSPLVTAAFGTYVRIVSRNGFQSDDGNQFDSGTSRGGRGRHARRRAASGC